MKSDRCVEITRFVAQPEGEIANAVVAKVEGEPVARDKNLSVFACIDGVRPDGV